MRCKIIISKNITDIDFLRSGKIKGIYVEDLKTTDTGSVIKS